MWSSTTVAYLGLLKMLLGRGKVAIDERLDIIARS